MLPERRVGASGIGAGRAVDWHPTMPELAAAATSISLLMPHVEPVLVRCVRRAAATEGVDDGVRARAAAWARQELAHHVEHRRFNDAVIERCGSGAARVDRWARRAYGWAERRGGVRWGAAFATGSEAIAFGIARWVDAHVATVFDGADPDVARVYLWHLAEEAEHRAVAHEVWSALPGARRRTLVAAAAMSLALLVVLSFAGTVAVLRAQGRLWRPVAWFRLARWSLSLAFTVLPTVAGACLPGHDPGALADPPYLRQWLRGFDAAA